MEKQIILKVLGEIDEHVNVMGKAIGNIHAGINESRSIGFLEKQGVQKLYDESNIAHGKFIDLMQKLSRCLHEGK